MELIMLIAAVFVVLGIGGYGVSIYNGLVLLSRNIDKAWANIDVILKQRHDEIPKLVKVCEGYMKYERGTLEKLTAARTACLQAHGVGNASAAENALTGALKSLFAVAENYPDLKSSHQFVQLQERVSHLESQIADRREFFNDSVNQYNIRINQIPDMVIAGLMRYQARELFKVAEEDRADVNIDFKVPE